MKILYAIQGTGNGHLSRSTEIVPILQKKADVDLLVSGMDSRVILPFKIKYRVHGMGFIFGKRGGVDLWNTYKKTDSRKFLSEVKELPVQDYDLVINDFEPVSAWAARWKNVPCVSLSHQSAVLNSKAPQPSKSDRLGTMILRHYAPTNEQYGFHFKRYDDNIYTPVIRNPVRKWHPSNRGHYTVYLPAFGDDLLKKKLSVFSDIQWEVFSKVAKRPMRYQNLLIKPIDNRGFIESMATSEGVLCGAGFETPAEALYLGKKLMVVPMKTQFEQQCNATALAEMGVPVIKNLKKKRFGEIEKWLNDPSRVAVLYPDITENIIDSILESQIQGEIQSFINTRLA